jgi:hypothetical protein
MISQYFSQTGQHQVRSRVITHDVLAAVSVDRSEERGVTIQNFIQIFVTGYVNEQVILFLGIDDMDTSYFVIRNS